MLLSEELAVNTIDADLSCNEWLHRLGILYGSACWARTSDPMINSHLLYQLS